MFDTDAMRRYGDRELRPEDSYMAEDLLRACDEIDRLRAELADLQSVPLSPDTETPDDVSDVELIKHLLMFRPRPDYLRGKAALDRLVAT